MNSFPIQPGTLCEFWAFLLRKSYRNGQSSHWKLDWKLRCTVWCQVAFVYEFYYPTHCINSTMHQSANAFGIIQCMVEFMQKWNEKNTLIILYQCLLLFIVPLHLTMGAEMQPITENVLRYWKHLRRISRWRWRWRSLDPERDTRGRLNGFRFTRQSVSKRWRWIGGHQRIFTGRQAPCKARSSATWNGHW